MYMDNKSLVYMAAKACDEKKAKDIKLIKIDKVSFISEWILIAEGLSDVQVRSITNSVEGELREKAKIEPIRKEGGGGREEEREGRVMEEGGGSAYGNEKEKTFVLIHEFSSANRAVNAGQDFSVKFHQ